MKIELCKIIVRISMIKNLVKNFSNLKLSQHNLIEQTELEAIFEPSYSQFINLTIHHKLSEAKSSHRLRSDRFLTQLTFYSLLLNEV